MKDVRVRPPKKTENWLRNLGSEATVPYKALKGFQEEHLHPSQPFSVTFFKVLA